MDTNTASYEHDKEEWDIVINRNNEDNGTESEDPNG